MTQDERKPTGMSNSTTELRQLIIDNPDLPLIVFAGENANNSSDNHYLTVCSSVSACVGEYLDCCQAVDDRRCYTDRDDFREDLADLYYIDFFFDNLDNPGADFEAFVEKQYLEYDPYWKKCIILSLDN